jgi:DNA-binding NtrC family response regulator
MDPTKWLHSPVSQKSFGLKPISQLILEPYFGKSKQLKLFRTQYIVGSGADCDIQVDDPYVSPQHAKIFIESEGAAYRVVDLASRNGVFLNGQRVLDAPLPERGNLQIGRSKLRWKHGEPETENENWVARSDKMQKLLGEIKDVAASDLPILLLGETGTGKEYLAKFVHDQSARKNERYVSVNGALTDGPLAESELFGHTKGAFTGAEAARVGAIRAANHGTLFLDEVADIPSGAQVKLLRALELGEVKPLGSDHTEKSNFRIVAATSQNMHKKIQQGTFRIDLYFRLAGACFHIPPLREREEDILAISEKIFAKNGCEMGTEIKSLLLSYDWPGNVRELKSWAQRAVVRARAEGVRVIRSEFFDRIAMVQNATAEEFLGKSLEEMEREMILQSLNRNGWARKAAAEELKISRSTLYDKMKKFGIRNLPATE